MTALDDERYADDDETPRERAPRARYTPPKDRDDSAYLKATRHSSLVRQLKFILPGIAVVAVIVFWASARVIPGDMSSLVAVSGIDTKSNSVVMDKPHISGFEGTRRAYEVRAESAVQNLDDPKVVTFKQIVGRFGLEDAGVATVNAEQGVFNGNNNTLMLKGGVSLQTTSGYSGRFSNAAIDLAKGSLVSSEPLDFTSADGKIHANAVNVADNGKHVIFSNGVSVTYLPPGELAQAPTNTGANP